MHIYGSDRLRVIFILRKVIMHEIWGSLLVISVIASLCILGGKHTRALYQDTLQLLGALAHHF